MGLPNYFAACLKAGVYLYNGDKGNASHHTLAARLSRKHQSRQELLTELVQDIRRHNQAKTFISSEDFQSILTSPDDMTLLINALKTSGAEKVSFLIYLRNPISYLTSMYITLLFFQHNVPFLEYFQIIMETGHYKYRKWKLHFDYQEIAQSLTAMGADFTFRDYHHLAYGNAMTDVLTYLGVPQIADTVPTDLRAGVTSKKWKFTRYCRHVLGEENTHPQMFNVFEKHLATKDLYLPLSDKERFLDRFEPALSYVDRRYGTNILAATQADLKKSQVKPDSAHQISYFDVFHDKIQSDIGPALEVLQSPKRQEKSRQLMTQWGWME